jgi:nitrate/nitrite transporter NarK
VQHRFTIATGLPAFIILLMLQAFFMALGKAAVFKHIPVYYPNRVGVVGGAVGAIGGLGGFVLPLAFGLMNDITDVWTSCFMLLFGIASVGLTWMHLRSDVRSGRRRPLSQISGSFRNWSQIRNSATSILEPEYEIPHSGHRSSEARFDM